MHGVKRRELSQELLRKKRARDADKIATYRALTAQVLQSKRTELYTPQELRSTTKLLELNPEFNAVWNFRRDIITALKSQLDMEFWDHEIKFTTAQLKAYPKVYWIWNHRFWCLKEYPGSPMEKWQMELALVNKLLAMDPRNFHSWHYRRIVVEQLENLTGVSLNQQELDYTTEKINANISNFSAWHQRASLLPRMFLTGQIADKKAFINHELQYITNAIFTDAEDQSVWYYVKWFVKSDCVLENTTQEEYKNMLRQLRESIIVINEDEKEFSGKENIWCLKLLIFLGTILEQEFEVEAFSEKSGLLKKLIEFDPLRRSRYLHLEKEK
ncbi:LADA_0E08460g1_1 [Lachancea dasiensis]|uniref:Geranylgeranyl transferase type-2 subunit alpha n=1 Tax=Lachancea dasiensis TaxID=1072105 RepID=A0A1G4JDB8_9SACH|nr:LADA_0E08460g1_1 [Lachancea dasiensis]